LLYLVSKIHYIKTEDIPFIKLLISKGLNIYHKDNQDCSLINYLKDDVIMYEIIEDYYNYYKITNELEIYKKINSDLVKELEILNNSLELHPDGSNIQILKEHFSQLSSVVDNNKFFCE